MSEESKSIRKRGRLVIGQDWASVAIGFGIIVFVILAGYSISTPSFGGSAGWKGVGAITEMFGSSSLLIAVVSTLLIFGVFSAIGVYLSGDSLRKFVAGFVAVCLLTLLAQFLSSFAGFKNLGLEAVLFSLILGLIIGNVFRLPDWLRTGVQTELYVKIGLVLLGVAAFAISVFWTYRDKSNKNGKKVSASIIWERFPKFVLGFIMASIIFSFLISPETAKASGKVIKSFSTFWFNLAFISIGMETRFAELKAMDNKKPFYGFLVGQGFNIFFTLLVSYILFQLIGT